ncbi:hypothetical protein NLG97_g2235 [Lecanicillium saksenae]|uniref:Uncharacterized protein n=1 Tax=Lecanicillium saksenae TaxID=468837 RepID=A0ACC1R4S9_9HYPO|nr:hypothetical protein NLG97_g2235 [Lecanicillium saksenae]
MEKFNSEKQVESEALLHDGDGESLIELRARKTVFSKRAAVIHALLFLGYTILSTFIVWSWKPQRPCDLIYSPAEKAVDNYHVVTFTGPLHGTSVYRGTPREELHAAWRELLKYHNIRVPKSDLDKINRTSIPLDDEEGGHLVTLEAFHHLHCLNQLRQQIYHEYYYPGVNEWNSTKRFLHVDHCIDILRQVLMCQGDVSLVSYKWIQGHNRPWSEFDVDHTCRDWNAVMKWAGDHHIPDEKMRGSVLTHPELGPAFPVDDKEEGEHVEKVVS